MSPEVRPEATRFQPGSEALPAALEPAIIDSDIPIVLLVAPDTGDEAARAAIGLAEARAAAGKPSILADASARRPRLHELLDTGNLEGMADVFLFGASLDRVRTRPETRAFDFVPTGPYVPDPRAVLESSRWARIARSLEADGERMFVFVPADTPGLGILSKRVGAAVLIGDPRSVERSAQRLDPACEVLAVLEPAPALAPDRLAAEAGAAGDPESATIFDAPDLTEPVVFRSDRKSRRVVSPVLLLLLLAAVLAAGWFAYHEYFAPMQPANPVEPARERPAEPRGEPVETPIPISVAVEAHQDLESARARMEALRQADPDIGFFLAPVAVRDVVYYRLLAGPVRDRESGDRLMERLVERQYKTAADPWAIRPTEFAFHLGDFGSQADAETRVAALAAVDIPTYVVSIRYDSGPPGYRVYGGAYETEGEAEVMREALTEAGEEARLVTRTGEPVPVGS